LFLKIIQKIMYHLLHSAISDFTNAKPQAAWEEKKKHEAEEYQARAIERAAAPTFNLKRTGKPSMARSLTQKKVGKEEGASAVKQADLELQRYSARAFP